MIKIYQVAGHRFMVSGKELCTVAERQSQDSNLLKVRQKDALLS